MFLFCSLFLFCVFVVNLYTSDDCEIVIFDVDNPIHSNNLSLNWYKRVLFSFTIILLCVPLSWFQELRKICVWSESSWKRSEDIKLIYNKFIRLCKFHSNTIEYDNKRMMTYVSIEKIKRNKRKILTDKYGDGAFIPKSLQTVEMEMPPHRSFWIYPDFQNVVENASHGYGVRTLWKNQGPAMFVSDKEQNFIENLTNWRNMMIKHYNKQNLNGTLTKQGSKGFSGLGLGLTLTDRMDERDDLKVNNKYYEDIIDYNEITLGEWKLLKKVTFLKTFKYFNILNEYTDDPYNKIDKINEALVTLTSGIDANDENDTKAKEFNSKFEEYTKMYTQLCNTDIRLNSEFKRCMHEVYLHIPYSFGVRPEYTSLMHDYRLEYYRLRLNYPSLYKNHPRLLLRNDFTVDNGYLRVNGINYNQYITNEQFEKHFNNTHVFYQTLTMSLSDAGGYRTLHTRQNAEISNNLRQVFRFAMAILCSNFKPMYYVQNYNVGTQPGIVVEKCLDFVYKVRLDALIKNKQLFDDEDSDQKEKEQKKNDTKDIIQKETMKTKKRTKRTKRNRKMDDILGSMKDINDDNIENDFQFENYLRIAFSDWNIARLGLIAKVIASGKVSSGAPKNSEQFVIAEGLFDDADNDDEKKKKEEDGKRLYDILKQAELAK